MLAATVSRKWSYIVTFGLLFKSVVFINVSTFVQIRPQVLGNYLCTVIYITKPLQTGSQSENHETSSLFSDGWVLALASLKRSACCKYCASSFETSSTSDLLKLSNSLCPPDICRYTWSSIGFVRFPSKLLILQIQELGNSKKSPPGLFSSGSPIYPL